MNFRFPFLGSWRFMGKWRWLVPGIHVKRFVALIAVSTLILFFGFLQIARLIGLESGWLTLLGQVNRDLNLHPWLLAGGLTLGGGMLMWLAVIGLSRSLLSAHGAQPRTTLERVFARRALKRGPRIVAIGGGTGLSNLLSGLKRFSANLTAIVAVTDDGGSSGRLRRMLNMPAPGDLTDCYAALSDSPVLSNLLTHRFDRGDELKGHTFGNLLLATLSEERGDFAEASLLVNEILNVRGRVIPATSGTCTLVSELEDGAFVSGESLLRKRNNTARIARVRLDPEEPPAMPEAVEAIQSAELIVMGPGSLYTSVIPPLLVPEVRTAVRQSRANLVYIANMFTEAGETDGLTVLEHIQALSKHLGRRPDVVLVNVAPYSEETLIAYQNENAEPSILNERRLASYNIRVIRTKLARNGRGQHDPDLLARTLVRLLVQLRFTPRIRGRRLDLPDPQELK